MQLKLRLLTAVTILTVTGTTYGQWTTSGNNIYNSNSGNVGIGTTSPGYKLEVFTSNVNDGLKMNSSAGQVLLHSGVLTLGAYNGITQGGDGGIVYGASTGTNFGLIIAPWNALTNGIRLDKTGNVGIGTADTKGYMLAVNGPGIFAKVVVKSYSNWPDFVFHSDYTLPSLDNVATYIKMHHHLPEMPSADSVAKNGLDLGSNQAALLKKIEELTLYIIEQNQKMADQSKELLAQKERIDRLERMIR